MDRIVKYPRTAHLKGSRLQPGDDDSDQVSVRSFAGFDLVFEEKVDGGNVGISCDPSGAIVLQSRGHVLRGGPRERQYDLLKAWAMTHEAWIRETLCSRFVLYGEWLAARHSCYYDRLPSLLMEFDILDKERGIFMSTPARRSFLDGGPVVSVPVIHEGMPARDADVAKLVRPSLYKSPDWRENLRAAAIEAGVDPERAERETWNSDLAEGVYLKVERDGQVFHRAKFIERGFVQTILDSGTHWAERPIIANRLAPGVDIFDLSYTAARAP